MRQLWFGNRRRMRWVKPFAASPQITRTGYETVTEFENGGAGIDASLDSHGEFALVWNTADVDDLMFLWDYGFGRYGNELVYWTDPMYARRNALPAAWSMPWMAAVDAMPLILERRPVKVDTPSATGDYPVHGAAYTAFNTDTARKVLVPIPPGYTAWVGVHGNAAAEDMVKVTPYEGMVAGAKVNPVVLGLTSTRVNTSFAGTDQSWIELSLDLDNIPDGEAKTFELYGLMVQILKTGATPETGDFIAGRGHSGCEFRGKPAEQPISAGLDKTAVTVKLLEVGAWL